MENEFMSRGYLLPGGCKDLSGAAKPAQKRLPDLRALGLLTLKKDPSLPPLTRQVFIPPKTSIYKLAELLGLKPTTLASRVKSLGMLLASRGAGA